MAEISFSGELMGLDEIRGVPKNIGTTNFAEHISYRHYLIFNDLILSEKFYLFFNSEIDNYFEKIISTISIIFIE